MSLVPRPNPCSNLRSPFRQTSPGFRLKTGGKLEVSPWGHHSFDERAEKGDDSCDPLAIHGQVGETGTSRFATRAAHTDAGKGCDGAYSRRRRNASVIRCRNARQKGLVGDSGRRRCFGHRPDCRPRKNRSNFAGYDHTRTFQPAGDPGSGADSSRGKNHSHQCLQPGNGRAGSSRATDPWVYSQAVPTHLVQLLLDTLES
jgi:hypothetical protein